MTIDIRTKLTERLNSKGLEANETELFIRDVIRIKNGSPESDIETIRGQLHLLGWRDDYTDYSTIQLVLACHQNE